MSDRFQIITFYEFKQLTRLNELKEQLVSALREHGVFGTIILADEGFNASLCGARQDIPFFIESIEQILDSKIVYKSSFHSESPFRKHEVKIKPEIVTLEAAGGYLVGSRDACFGEGLEQYHCRS